MTDLRLRIGPRVSEEAKPIYNHQVWTRPGYQSPHSQKKRRFSSNWSMNNCSSATTEGELARMNLDVSSRQGTVDNGRRHYLEQDGDILGEPIMDGVTPNKHHLDNTTGMIKDSLITDENLHISAFRDPLTGKRIFSPGGSHAPQDFRADSCWSHTSNDRRSDGSTVTSSSVSDSLLSRAESSEWSRLPLKDRIAPLVRKNFKLRPNENKIVPNSNSDKQILDDESLDAILTPEFYNSIFDTLNTARSQLAEKRSAKSSQQEFYSIISEQDKDTSIELPIGPPTTPLGSKSNARIRSSLPIWTLEQGQDIKVSADHQQSIRASSLTVGLSSQHIAPAGLDAPLVDTQRKTIPLNSAIVNRASNLPTPPNTASPLGTASSMEHNRSINSRSSPNDARPPRSTGTTRRSSSPLARLRRSASSQSRSSRSPRQWDSSYSNNRRQTSPSRSHELGRYREKSLSEPSERSLTLQECSNKNELQQSNASTGENIVDSRVSLPRAPDESTSQSSMRLMPSEQMASLADHGVKPRETSPQDANLDISSKLASGVAQSSADTHVTSEKEEGEISTDMDTSSDTEIHISAQVKEGKDHHWKPFNDIPGIWLFKQGSSEPDVLEETFEIPKEILQKWQSKSLEDNMGDSVSPSANFTEAPFESKSTSPLILSWNLLCVATDSVDFHQETLSRIATTKELLKTLSSMQGQWPTSGQLIIEINPDQDIEGVFYGHDLDACINVTGHIHSTAPNMIRFIQLEDVSQYVFILFAKPILEFSKTCGILPLEDLQMMLQKSRLDRGSTLITGSVIVEKL